MSHSELRKEISNAFSNVGMPKLDDAVLSKCVTLSLNYNIKAKQMANSWEAFSMNQEHNSRRQLSEHCFNSFRNAVLKDHHHDQDDDVFTNTAVQVRPRKKPRSTSPPPLQSKRPNAAVVSPQKTTATSSLSVPSYQDRPMAGKVVIRYNHNNPQQEPETEQQCMIAIDVAKNYNGKTCNVMTPYRHMFTPVTLRAKILDQHAATLGDCILRQARMDEKKKKNDDSTTANNDATIDDVDDFEVEAVGVPRQDVVTCVGRICNEAHEGRMNRASVLLQGLRHHSGAMRTHLDLSQLTVPFSLFSGQIVAVRGINVTGRNMVVQNIYSRAAWNTNATKEETLEETKQEDQVEETKQEEQTNPAANVKIMCACGPFTTTIDNDYHPLIDFLGTVMEESPDICILMGPFVSIHSQDVTVQWENDDDETEGDVMNVSFQAFFAQKITPLIQECLETMPSIQFILLPSLDDAVAEWVFPQAPLHDSAKSATTLPLPHAQDLEHGTLGLKALGPRVHCVSNPSTLCLNHDVIVGMTSVDTLLDLSSTDETSGNLRPGTRMARMAQHLVEQGSYYPLFPPCRNLDLRQMSQWQMPRRPNLLILPSKLSPFATSILDDETIAVNPGHLAKGRTGGTYGIINIRGRPEKSFKDCVQVQVIRI